MKFLSFLLSGIARWRAASTATDPGWRTTVVRITILLLLSGPVSSYLH